MPMHHGFYRNNSYDEEEDVLLYLMLFIYLLAAWLAGSKFFDQGLSPHPWQRKHRVLTTGPPGNS